MGIVQEITMAKVMSGITIRVKISHATRVRLWLGTHVIALAGRILGCDVNVTLDTDG